MGAWETYKLGDLAKHVKERYPVSALTLDNYISTENVLPNRGGRVTANTLPQAGNVVAWRTDDVLVPNIRPYFKKIWRGQGVGGASADVMVIRVRDEQKILPRLLYYYLSSDAFFAHVMAGANGAKMPRGNRTYTMQFELSLPSLEEQERIAGVLGAYDDLIAVNERRMALLEEAAHRLYRDRFVTHVDPTWDRKPLGEMAEFIHNTYRPSENWPFITYLDTGNITRNRIDTLVTAPFRDLPTSAKRKVSPGDFIYSTVRPNKLHYGLFLQVPEHFLVSTAFAVIRGKIAISSSIYLYHLLIDEQMTDYLHAIGEQTSATYPTINEDDMAPMTVLCPPLEIQEEFTRYVLPYHEAFDTLARENALLREGRDRLLPRLLREEA